MGILTRAGALCAGLLLTGAAWVTADTVVLTDGTRLSGEVTSAPQGVLVRSDGGILKLPAWRVDRVEKGGQLSAMTAPAKTAAPAPAAAPAPQTAPAKAEPAAPAAAAGPKPGPETGGPPSVAEALKRKVDADFEGMPLHQVLDYLHELTGVNMVLAQEVRADTEPVYLHLKNVTVKNVLDLALGLRGYSYVVKPGEVIYVRAGLTSADLELRVYNVKDLILSIEDQYGTRAGGGGSSTTGRAGGGGGTTGTTGSRGGGLGLQVGMSGGRATLQTTAPAQQVGTYTVPLSARTQQFILLMQGTCGEGTWAVPGPGGSVVPGYAASATAAGRPAP